MKSTKDENYEKESDRDYDATVSHQPLPSDGKWNYVSKT